MNPFTLSLESERTSLLLALFFTLLIMLALVFVTFGKSAKRPNGLLNIGLFLCFFALLIHLCTEHNRIADGQPSLVHSTFPLWGLWCAVGALLAYAAFGIASERRRRSRTIDRNSIKEALDTLPMAVCYFTEKGLVKLCNLQMHRLFYVLSQSDLQSLDELHSALHHCNLRTGIIKLSGDQSVYLFPSGQAWHFSEKVLSLADGSRCTEAVFYDVTELYEKEREIETQTKKLRELGRSIRALSKNVVAATKEEEMLSYKTALHDRMDAGLVAARQVLLQNRPLEELGTIIHEWKLSVTPAKQGNSTLPDHGELSELIRDAKAIGVELQLNGELPSAGDAPAIFLNAIRECLTNCVRHADGTELYINISHNASIDTIIITNNGKPPQEEIVPRGGLSNLIKHVRYLGGTIQIQSLPEFLLTVSIPENRGTSQ